MKPIIDSAMTLEQALEGLVFPEDIRATIALIDVRHIGFDGQLHQGQLVIHQAVTPEVTEIFEKLLEMRFPIERIVPVVAYQWNDDRSMVANNSSAFNYRLIAGTNRLSNHSHGLAIDINPALNPYTQKDGIIVPLGANYDPTKPGTITKDGPVVTLFSSHGWGWGGDWERKDWQHFEKPDVH